MSGDLVVHSGGWLATREEVAAVRVPKNTASYVGVPHTDVLDLAKELVEANGFRVMNERLALARKGNHMFAVFDTVPVGNSPRSISFGARNSYDKVFPVSFGGGKRVFACDNLSFFAEFMFRRRHTTRIFRDLAPGLARMFDRIMEADREFEVSIGKMIAREVTVSEADHVMMRAVRARAIPATAVLQVQREFFYPTIAEFREMPSNLWRLYNAVTSVAKGWTEAAQTKNTLRLSRLFGAIADAEVIDDTMPDAPKGFDPESN